MSSEKINICIIAPDKNFYSETFIHSHVENLPGCIYFLYGGSLPSFYGNDRPFLKTPGFLERCRRFLLRKFLKCDFSETTLKKKALGRFFVQNRIDVVLAEYGPTGFAVNDVCKSLNIPLVVHFHGYDAYEKDILAKTNQYHDLFAYAQAIVVVSKDMEKQLFKLGAPSEKLVHIVYGIDCVQFDGAHPKSAPLVFVAGGRFVGKKAPYLTVLAFQEVLRQVPEAKLVMFGNGHLLETCKQMIKSLGMMQSVTFLGSCSHSEVADMMKRSRAFLQHSVKTEDGDSEGTPLSILEAGASGLPVVATRHAGILDVVLDGQTGFLVDEGDIITMAEAIVKLAKDADLAQKMGQAAQKHIRANCTKEKSIDKLYSVIQSAVNNQKGKRND